MPKKYSLEEQGVHNRDFLTLQIESIIKKLFKSSLDNLDFLSHKASIPDQDYQEFRKRILDAGNESVRDIQNILDVFDFYINPERLQIMKDKYYKKTKYKVPSKIYNTETGRVKETFASYVEVKEK